ncbi:MAG TPA: hypothetical protein VGN13_05495 [Solirubrobacteraceae bacterium]|jgi:hypothetical protein
MAIEGNGPDLNAATEPATPAEGELTEGAVGVARRQTFRYVISGAESQVVSFPNNTGSLDVLVFLFVGTAAVALTNALLSSLDEHVVMQMHGLAAAGTPVRIILMG